MRCHVGFMVPAVFRRPASQVGVSLVGCDVQEFGIPFASRFFMTCRVQATPPSDRAMISTLQKEPVFLELVQTDRKADFWWLAQSRGIPIEKIERLWQALRALAGVEDLPPLAPTTHPGRR